MGFGWYNADMFDETTPGSSDQCGGGGRDAPSSQTTEQSSELASNQIRNESALLFSELQDCKIDLQEQIAIHGQIDSGSQKSFSGRIAQLRNDHNIVLAKIDKSNPEHLALFLELKKNFNSLLVELNKLRIDHGKSESGDFQKTLDSAHEVMANLENFLNGQDGKPTIGGIQSRLTTASSKIKRLEAARKSIETQLKTAYSHQLLDQLENCGQFISKFSRLRKKAVELRREIEEEKIQTNISELETAQPDLVKAFRDAAAHLEGTGDLIQDAGSSEREIIGGWLEKLENISKQKVSYLLKNRTKSIISALSNRLNLLDSQKRGTDLPQPTVTATSEELSNQEQTVSEMEKLLEEINNYIVEAGDIYDFNRILDHLTKARKIIEEYDLVAGVVTNLNNITIQRRFVKLKNKRPELDETTKALESSADKIVGDEVEQRIGNFYTKHVLDADLASDPLENLDLINPEDLARRIIDLKNVAAVIESNNPEPTNSGNIFSDRVVRRLHDSFVERIGILEKAIEDLNFKYFALLLKGVPPDRLSEKLGKNVAQHIENFVKYSDLDALRAMDQAELIRAESLLKKSWAWIGENFNILGNLLDPNSALFPPSSPGVANSEVVSAINEGGWYWRLHERAIKEIRQRMQKYDKEVKSVDSLTWAELNQEIRSLNLNIWNHADHTSPHASSRIRQLYIRFHAEKMTKQTNPKLELERIEQKVRTQLATADNIMQMEGQMASTARRMLLGAIDNDEDRGQIEAMDFNRYELMVATTCHPRYGIFIRDLLQDVIKEPVPSLEKEGGKRIKKQRLKYEDLTSSSGRVRLREFVEKRIAERLKDGQHIESQREGDLENISDLVCLLYTTFCLIDISFAALLKHTKTRAHNTQKSYEDLDMPSLTNPDWALIHRGFRYGASADWTLWYTIFVEYNELFEYAYDSTGIVTNKPTPESVGPNKEKHEKLLEKQQELLLYLDTRYDVSSFTPFVWNERLQKFVIGGESKSWNLSTSIDEPIFPYPTSVFTPHGPQSFQYSAGEVCLVKDEFGRLMIFGSNGPIERKNKTDVAEDDIIVYDVQDRVVFAAPKTDSTIYARDKSRYKIVSTSDKKEDGVRVISQYKNALGAWKEILGMMFKRLPAGGVTRDDILGGSEASKGMIDKYIALAGRAKMWPGNHLENSLTPFLTKLIYGLFSLYPATGGAREQTYRKVVKKLEASFSGGGLEAYESQIREVIENISEQGRAGEKMSRNLALLGLDYRHAQRERYLRFHYRINNKSIPKTMGAPELGGFFNSIIGGLTGGNPDHDDFFKILEGQKSLPKPDVSTDGTFESVVDGKK